MTANSPYVPLKSPAVLESDRSEASGERLRLQEAIEASGERLRLQEAIEAIGEGFALWDAEDHLVLCNSRYHDFWQGLGESVQPGVSYQTLLKQVARLGLVDLDGEDPERWMRQRIAARAMPTGPYTHQFSDGRIVQVNNTRTADGGMVTVFSDVSALLEVEEARRLRAVAEGAALLASTVTNIAQGVGVFNASQRLLTWNRRACELLNIPYYAVQRGMSVRELMDLLARNRAKLEPRVNASILAWIDRRRPRAPTQVDVLYPGATVIEAAFRAMPDHGFVVTFTDKTAERQAKRTLEQRREELALEVRARTRELVEVNLQLQREVRQRREAAEALEQARASAVAANLSKTKFLAAASHDLLQPLSAAHLYLSALEDAKAELSQSAQKHLAGLAGALLSVEGLLNALLEISKLDSGGIEPDWQTVPLQPLLDDLGRSFAGLAAEKGLRFRWVRTSAWARTDPVLLRRILQNLMTNAVKYTNSGGVLVGVRPDGDAWRIEVWDSGPGIPPSEQEVIFDEFQRGSGWEVGEVAGAGLGLAIVRRTIDLLGHRVTLRSERGYGTLFRVHLPRAAEEARVEPARRAVPPATLKWQNRLVLMLENDPDIAKGMQALFTRWNCPLLAAASLEALLEALADEEARPDFVIADLDLDTEVNGLMAVEQLRAIYPGLPAALVTADRSAETAENAAALGIERFLKPIRPAELRAYMDHCFREASGLD
jgi:two-component system, sensor histidine kinase